MVVFFSFFFFIKCDILHFVLKIVCPVCEIIYRHYWKLSLWYFIISWPVYLFCTFCYTCMVQLTNDKLYVPYKCPELNLWQCHIICTGKDGKFCVDNLLYKFLQHFLDVNRSFLAACDKVSSVSIKKNWTTKSFSGQRIQLYTESFTCDDF